MIKYRYAKYTPQHDFCVAIFYGNFAPQNAGVICTQTLDENIVNRYNCSYLTGKI